jgi:hypothetical protein
MSFDRSTPGTGSEPGAPPASAGPSAADGVSPSLRLQILSAEHWSLLASRSLAWNEVFARAGMFLSAVSGAVVAIALVGQGSGFGPSFVLFALLILPVVLFLGVATFLRMSSSNWHDAQCVIGMNRIRAGYLDLAPELERYFVMSAHDDRTGVTVTMGQAPGTNPLVHLLAATPTVVSVVDSVLAAAIAGLLAIEVAATTPVVLAVGAVVFVISFAAHSQHGCGMMVRSQASQRPVFPSHGGDR